MIMQLGHVTPEIVFLQDLTKMDPAAIALPCTRARALAHLDDVNMYFKNPGIRRTVESFLDSVTTIA